MLIYRNWTQLNKAILIICFSGNAPIEITISEVCIDHSKPDRTLFSMDNNNRKGKKNDRDRIAKLVGD